MLFPTSVALVGYSNDNLQKLVFSLDKGLKKIGITDDKKYASKKIFFGVISLCRFTHKPTKKFLDAVEKISKVKIETLKLKVKDLYLITCNCMNNPKTRKIIETYQLTED